MPEFALPGYEWNVKAGRYVSLKPYRFVARAKIADLLDQQVEQRERELGRVLRAVGRGEIAPGPAAYQMGQELRRMQSQLAAMGAGGFDRLTARDWGRVGAALKDDYRRLLAFTNEIAEGKLSDAAIQARLNMYCGRARTQYYRAERDRAQASKPGYTLLERRVLHPAEHCEDCLAYAAAGLQRVGVLPVPGRGSRCITNCRCTMERVEVKNPEQWIVAVADPAWAELAAFDGEYAWDAELGNPYHDAAGKFTTKAGAGASGGASGDPLLDVLTPDEVRKLGMKDLLAEMRRDNAARQAKIDALIGEHHTKYGPDTGMVLVKLTPDGRAWRGILIGRSSKYKGVQVTYFDADGFSSDFESTDLRKALTEIGLVDGWKLVAPVFLDRAAQTPRFWAGVQRTLSEADFGNPYHDAAGKFTTKAGAVTGSPASSSFRAAVAAEAESVPPTPLSGGVCKAELITYEGDGSGVWKQLTAKQGQHDGRSEVMAYEVARFLGMDIVPETVFAFHNGVAGTSQQFIPDARLGYDFEPGDVFDKIKATQKERLEDMLLLDAVIANGDRHGGNWLVDADDRVWAIDHGHTRWNGESLSEIGRLNDAFADGPLVMDGEAGKIVLSPERRAAWSQFTWEDWELLYERVAAAEPPGRTVETNVNIHAVRQRVEIIVKNDLYWLYGADDYALGAALDASDLANPYHGPDGRFTDKAGAGSASIAAPSPMRSNVRLTDDLLNLNGEWNCKYGGAWVAPDGRYIGVASYQHEPIALQTARLTGEDSQLDTFGLLGLMYRRGFIRVGLRKGVLDVDVPVTAPSRQARLQRLFDDTDPSDWYVNVCNDAGNYLFGFRSDRDGDAAKMRSEFGVDAESKTRLFREVSAASDLANPYHGADGKFTTKAGAVGGGAANATTSPFRGAARGENEASAHTLQGGVCLGAVVQYADDGSGIWKQIEDAGGDHNGNSEVAAYELSQLLGLAHVPETVYAEHRSKPGTVQQFVAGQPGTLIEDKEGLLAQQKDEFRDMLLLDTIIGNEDRHDGNWMYDAETQTLWSIDNGHAQWTLATVDENGERNRPEKGPLREDYGGGAPLSPARQAAWAKITKEDFRDLQERLQTVAPQRPSGVGVNMWTAWLRFERIRNAGGLFWGMDPSTTYQDLAEFDLAGNPYHDALGRFASKAGAVGAGAGGDTPFRRAATTGAETSSKMLYGGVCQAELVNYQDDGGGVWKELSADQGDHDGRSEVAAYAISQMLGLNIVPETVFALHKGRVGTSQQFIPDARVAEVFGGDEARNVKREQRERLEDMLLLDVVIGNWDRHEGNWLTDKDGKVWAIDHGHSTWDLDSIDSSGRIRTGKMRGPLIDHVEGGHLTLSPARREAWSRIGIADWKALMAQTAAAEPSGRGMPTNVDIAKAMKRFQTITIEGGVKWGYEFGRDNPRELAADLAGNPYHGPDGRFTTKERAGSAYHPVTERVWDGKRQTADSTLSKRQVGALAEALAIHVMGQRVGTKFETLNVGVNNAPIDVGGDHMALEVKGGLASNGKSAQHWRATIGQPGPTEAALLKQMTAPQKRAHNVRKQAAILTRKQAFLDRLSAKSGQEVKPFTVGVILSPDGRHGDVWVIPGFHARIGWNTLLQEHAGEYAGTWELDPELSEADLFNPYHDERGRFTSKAGAGAARGSGAADWRQRQRELAKTHPITPSGEETGRPNDVIYTWVDRTGGAQGSLDREVAQFRRDMHYGALPDVSSAGENPDARMHANQFDALGHRYLPAQGQRRSEIKAAGAVILNETLQAAGIAAQHTFEPLFENDEPMNMSLGDDIQASWAYFDDNGSWQDHLTYEAAQRYGTDHTLPTRGMQEVVQGTAPALEKYGPEPPAGGLGQMMTAVEAELCTARQIPEVRRLAYDSIYTRTQAHLAQQGLGPDDTITLYRGMSLPVSPGKQGDTLQITFRPLTSFTTDPNVTLGFFNNQQPGDYDAIIAYKVPRKAIFGHWATGFGCAAEEELVVLGDYLHDLPGTLLFVKQLGRYSV